MIKNQANTVLGLFAHPDDAEFLCAGTLALLQQQGWDIHIATLTPGDKGTVEHTREQISTIRKQEGQRAAEILGAHYHCLDCEDLYITYDRQTLKRACALLREIRPSIVFTCSPTDYMVDHEVASRIAQTACFACGVKNMEVEVAPFEPVPHLYYCDPVDGKDILGREVRPTILVDISSVMATKEAMLCCHKSQRDWLRAHHGVDEYVDSMKAFAVLRGSLMGWEAGEGFRQHLGHCYPQDNRLATVLPTFVFENEGLY
jgi:LmbE family N-acetylglucosaminyl deacetylase